MVQNNLGVALGDCSTFLFYFFVCLFFVCLLTIDLNFRSSAKNHSKRNWVYLFVKRRGVIFNLCCTLTSPEKLEKVVNAQLCWLNRFMVRQALVWVLKLPSKSKVQRELKTKAGIEVDFFCKLIDWLLKIDPTEESPHVPGTTGL